MFESVTVVCARRVRACEVRAHVRRGSCKRSLLPVMVILVPVVAVALSS